MKKMPLTILSIISALFITFLFHNHPLGLNLVLFELTTIVVFFIQKQINLKSFFSIGSTIVLVLSSTFTLITHSNFVYIMNYISLMLFIGVHLYPTSKSLVTSFYISIVHFIQSQKQFLTRLFNTKINGWKLGKYIWKFRIFILPIVLILIFLILYSNSNPIFQRLFCSLENFIIDLFKIIVNTIEFSKLFTLFIGLIISNYVFIKTTNNKMIQYDSNSNDTFFRNRKRNNANSSFLGLKNELKSALFLFTSLNILLLILNSIEINSVWFNFEWTGSTLKTFVHDGTYLLIVSILLSIGLVLYYFRNNMNFYQKNKFLKTLTYLWLIQNGILVFSVLVRNYWYIKIYSLAHLRIGLIIFLALTLFGLYSVFIKVYKCKSLYYIFKVNFLGAFLLLTVCSFVNWDRVIAKYNVSQSNTSYFHFDYLANLSDATLPITDLNIEQLETIESIHHIKFSTQKNKLNPERYIKHMSLRKVKFITKWKSKSILSWNLAEYLVYEKLSKTTPKD